jgi:hypothetical protein
MERAGMWILRIKTHTEHSVTFFYGRSIERQLRWLNRCGGLTAANLRSSHPWILMVMKYGSRTINL